LVLIFSFLAWFFLNYSLTGQAGDNWLLLFWGPAASFIILGVLTGLAFLLEEKKGVIFIFCALTLLPSFLFFRAGLVGVIGVLLAFLFSFGALPGLIREKNLRLKILPIEIIKKGLAGILSAWVILAALLFYWAPYAQSLGQEIAVPRPIFNAVMKPLISFFVSGSYSIQTNSFDKNALPNSFSPIKEPIIQDSQLDEIYGLTNKQLNVFGAAYKKFIPLGAAVSVFFTFKILSFLLFGFIILFIWLIFHLLLLFKVVRINRIPAEKEIIEI
jgi:hypothetical protein